MVSGAETSFNPRQPVAFPLCDAREGVGRLIQSIPGQLGQTRVADAEKECLRSLSNSGGELALRRLEPKGRPADSLELLDWVPEDWKASRNVPEALRGLGAPHLLVSKVGTSRYGPAEWPLVGIGQFLVVTKGLSLSRSGQESPLGGQWSSLFEEMSTKAFTEWANVHMQFQLLQEGEAAWVPYG